MQDSKTLEIVASSLLTGDLVANDSGTAFKAEVVHALTNASGDVVVVWGLPGGLVVSSTLAADHALTVKR